MTLLKDLIKRILLRFGVRLVRSRILEPSVFLDNKFTDAFRLQYQDIRNGVVVNASLKKGRGLPLFSYQNSSPHPLVVSARAAIAHPQDRLNVVQSLLSQYYARVRPTNANAMLGLVSKRPELNDFPGWAVVMPWDKEDAFAWKEKIVSSVMSENTRYGKKAGVDYGWAWAGPSSEIKCEIESRRLLGVLDSIVKSGYKRHNGPDGDIVANVLAKSADDWVWQSIGAQHRAAVLAALEHEYVPIRIMKVIRREDVSSWPNVVRGLYTESEALNIFDNIFDANYSHITADWELFVAENGLVQ